MTKQILRDLAKGFLIAAVPGVILFLIARYGFADDRALRGAIATTVGIAIMLVVLYIERRGWAVQRGSSEREISVPNRVFIDVTERLLLGVAVGGVIFLVSRYLFAFDYPLYNAVKVTISLSGLVLLQYVVRKGWKH